jgi:MFS family permease
MGAAAHDGHHPQRGFLKGRVRLRGAYRWYVLCVLVLAYVCSFIDRTIISVLVTPLKADLHLSDAQIGLLQGTAFALFYVTAGVLIARLADRYSRRNLIAAGLVVWCLATAGGTLANSFLALLVFRMAVGAGESTLTPSATSLISDLFPRERLGTAMSIYAAAPYMGTGLALIIGGAVLDHLLAQPRTVVPLLGQVRPWQFAFLIVGLPGLLIAIVLLWTVREPERKEICATAETQREAPSARDFARYMRDHSDVYSRLFLGISMLSLVGYGLTAWLPTYYVRAYGMSNVEIGSMLGPSFLIGGSLGALCGGLIGDALRLSRPDAPVLLALTAVAGCLVFGAAVVLVDAPRLSSLLVIPTYVFKVLPLGALYGAMHAITPNRMRAQMMALFLFVDALVGLGLGPTVIGLFTDFVFRDESKLGLALLSTIAIAMTIAAVVFSSLRKPFIRVLQSTHA